MKKQEETKKGIWLFNQIFQLKGLASTDVIVLSTVYYLKKRNINLNISINKLSQTLRLPQSTVDLSIKKVIKLGYLEEKDGSYIATQEEIYNSTNYIYINEDLLYLDFSNVSRLYLLLDIISFTKKTGEYFKKNKTISKDLNISIRTISRSIAELSEFNLISIIYKSGKRVLIPNTYDISHFKQKVVSVHQKKKIVQPEAPKSVLTNQPNIKKKVDIRSFERELRAQAIADGYVA